MEGSGDPCGIISKEQLERLVQLFERFQYAPDPTTRECKEAESEFNDLLVGIQEKLPESGINISLVRLKALVRGKCQEIIVRDSKKHAILPPSA